MAIIVRTSQPSALLAAIKREVDQGNIETWSYDRDGDFTHDVDQWKHRAWLRPVIEEERLVFRTVPPKSRAISRIVYGVYHGRFIEMLLNHFDGKFTEATATAMPSHGDSVRAKALKAE